jgi:hypothetical protein
MPETRWGRDLLLTLIVLLGVAGTGLLGGSDGGWFPQRYAHDFYVAKGLTAVVAVVLILWHMSRAWPTVTTSGQRLRYLALLMVTVLIASSSTAQIDARVPVAGRNIGGLLAAVLVIVAMVVSLRQDRRQDTRP